MSGKDGVEVIICPFTVNIIISNILSVFLMSDLMLSLVKFFKFFSWVQWSKQLSYLWS